MKKYPFLILLALLCLVVSVSGCVSNQNQTNNTTSHYSQNGISFDYPGSWNTANAVSNNSVAAVADPNSVASTGEPQTFVLIQKSNATAGSDMQTVYDANYASLFTNTSYQRVSEANITVNGAAALENVYTVNSTSATMQMRAVWLKENSDIYVILCGALQSDFSNQQNNFNLVVNSFTVQ
ncbi:hypothetical protein DSECCO2_29180 [anaerobic digester metagenome]